MASSFDVISFIRRIAAVWQRLFCADRLAGERRDGA
jgi:hypothetical protein